MQNPSIGIHILASCLPRKRISSADLAAQFGLDPGIVQTKLGLTSKAIALEDDEHPSDFSVKSAKMAMQLAGVQPGDIGRVIYTGVSRDYLPSWSMALEIIGRLKLPNAVGFDLTMGCVSTLMALELSTAMNSNGRGPFVLICAAERWSHTISRKVPFSIGALAHADGGASCLVGPGASNKFGSLSGLTIPELNAHIYIPAGGTQEPFSEKALRGLRHYRQKGTPADLNIVDLYIKSYIDVIEKGLKINAALMKDFQFLITNQVRSEMRMKIAQSLKIDSKHYPSTYETLGHLGSADVLVSLEKIWSELKPGNTVMCATSTPGTYGALPIIF